MSLKLRRDLVLLWLDRHDLALAVFGLLLFYGALAGAAIAVGA